MNKTIVMMVLVIVALAAFAPSVAYAQTPQPPVPGTGSPMRGYSFTGVEGPLHDYMVNAMAAALGISASDFEARLATGKTAYQIALDLGISADKIPALLADAHAKALDAAATDKVIIQQQADWMKSRGAGMVTGNCIGMAQRLGGRMGRGGHWQQATP